MTSFASVLRFDAELRGRVLSPGGGDRDLGVLSRSVISRPISYWRHLWSKLRREMPFVAAMSFGAFVAWVTGTKEGCQFALVTTAGMNYLMTTFVSGASPLTNFTYHDCGTGTSAAAISDTALQTPAGSARVSGTATNPTAIQYRNVATLTPGGTLAITEWGLFSASTVGTLWDHRIFAAINVVAADSIQFTYTVTGTAGGS